MELRWLYQLRRSETPLPRRQEAELETFKVGSVELSALVTHEEVAEWANGNKDAIICSVSHAWETKEHPDPCAWQLGQLVDSLALYDAAYSSDLWVFYDYTSLYQFLRQPGHQQNSSRKGMQNMHLLFAHDFTLTLRIHSLTPDEIWNAALADVRSKIPVCKNGMLRALPLIDLVHNRTLYERRGWCKAEMEWSAARGIFLQNQRIDGSSSFQYGGKVPMSSMKFKKLMASSAFTYQNDEPQVVHLQRKVFHEKVTVVKEAIFEHMQSHELEDLIKALPLYKAEEQVFEIFD